MLIGMYLIGKILSVKVFLLPDSSGLGYITSETMRM